MNEFYEKAIERLRDDKGLSGNKETAMAPAVREALEKFCEEDGEFAQAVAQGVASGVVFFATVHCDTPAGLHKKPPLAALLATGAFAKAAFLSGRAHPGTVSQWVTL